MRLEKVKIKGFRSIEEMEINFTDTNYMVLVGKNEGGKSSILKALSLLSGEYEFKNADVKEMYGDNARVIFSCSLHSSEIAKCAIEFYELFPGDIDDQLTNELTIQEYFQKQIKYIFYIVEHGKKGYWSHGELGTLKTASQWYQVLHEFPQDHEPFSSINVSDFVNQNFVDKSNFGNEVTMSVYLSQINVEDIESCLNEIIRKIAILDKYTFPVANWEYSASEHDLPSHVNLNEFADNPDTCLPLLSMFLLSSIKKEDIQKRLTEVKEKSTNSFRNLLEQISEKTNVYIKENWKEYKEIKIELHADGENITIGIKEVHAFNFSQRSDGFRRLVSFLLMISMKNIGNGLDEQLILIDEPETGLHPSSAKNLRNKLVELSKDNLVVYATHSISMIDKDNIENNLIVSKKNEETKITIAKEDGTSSAENIYRAIGHSIYDDLKKINILLEGYTDKKTLGLFMVGAKWNKLGKCYTGGVKNIKHIISVLDLADRKYFVLSDADKVATQERRKMENPSYWYTYNDLDSDAVTVEDFYKQKFFSNIVTKILTKNDISIDGLELGRNRIKSIKNHFARNEVGSPNSKLMINTIKRECIKNIRKIDIDEEKITNVLDALLEKINPSDG